MSEDFVVAGETYRAGKMNAMLQFHVVRRLAPVFGSLREGNLAGAMDGDEASLVGLLGPLGDAVAAMTDADSEYVLGACLGACQRQEKGGLGWSQVWNAQARRIQYDDINLMALMTIVFKVLMSNVGGFTSGLPQTSLTGAAAVPKSTT